MKKANIGIIGYGFVGRAVAHGFQGCNLIIADPLLGTSTADMVQTKEKFDAIFICVPTPMGSDGVIDASIVEKVLFELRYLETLLVLKSTVVPDIVEKLAVRYTNFIYNPEFLTERNALRDFEWPIMHVFGGELEQTRKLELLYIHASICNNDAPRFHMSAVEASFVKYTMNSFLTAKVLFFNQIEALCSKYGADYNTVREAVTTDPRIAPGHTMVPGNDGRYGAGGSCFLKDTAAFSHFSDCKLTILDEVIRVNKIIRGGYSNLLEREIAQHVKL